MDFCLLWMLCVVWWRSFLLSIHISIIVLPSVVCLNVIVKPHNYKRLAHQEVLLYEKKNICLLTKIFLCYKKYKNQSLILIFYAELNPRNVVISQISPLILFKWSQK